MLYCPVCFPCLDFNKFKEEASYCAKKHSEEEIRRILFKPLRKALGEF